MAADRPAFKRETRGTLKLFFKYSQIYASRTSA